MHTFPELARITSGHFRTTQWHSARTSGTFPEAVHFPARFFGREIRNKREYNFVVGTLFKVNSFNFKIRIRYQVLQVGKK